MTAVAQLQGIIERKKKALFDNLFSVHSYNYSHEIHGYTFMIENTVHIVLNAKKSEEERWLTQQELIKHSYKNPDKALILIHGAEREVLLAPYQEQELKMNLFEFARLIENINTRGVQ